MSKHSKAQKRQSHLLRKEYSTNMRRHVRKRISNTADDYILERRRFLNKRYLLFLVCEESFLDELVWEYYCYRGYWLDLSKKTRDRNVSFAKAYRERAVLV